MATTFILPKSSKNNAHAGIAKDLTSLLVCCGQRHACATWTVRLDMPRLPWPRFRTALNSGSDLRATPGHSTSASGRRKAGSWSLCCLLQGCFNSLQPPFFLRISGLRFIASGNSYICNRMQQGKMDSDVVFRSLHNLHQDLFLHPASQALLIAMNYPGTAAERKCAGNDLDKVTGILQR